MNEKNKELTELTVESLFAAGQYIIPIYQRNYAWGKTEIEQLLQDLMDAAKQGNSKDYYLGSLVVHQRQNGQFEVIDGQQRHTTLSILIAVLKNINKHNPISQQTNLTFEHRSLSSKTLQHLFEKGVTGNEAGLEDAMVYAYNVAKNFLSDTNNLKVDLGAFEGYLAKHAILLRVIVPTDTDLNHYFEIMNSRGEQLEKHEVLKARLMAELAPKEQTAFNKIWTACSDMSRYVQMGFSSRKENNVEHGERMAIFGEDWNQCPTEEVFDNLVTLIASEPDKCEVKTLASVLKTPEFKDKNGRAEEEGKWGSVINFPNFLLQVLAVQYPDSEISLDDKKLLESFEQHRKYQVDLSQFAKDFIAALLQIRFLFDKWVIKSNANEDGHWHLRSIKPSTEKSGYSFANSAPNEAKRINDQLIMMLSMRHVSFPSQNYKQWFLEALKHLYEHRESEIDGAKYLAFLEGKSDDYFKERYISDDVLHAGTAVPHFLFNRLDYLLWKKIVINNEELSSCGDTDKVEEIKSLASNFKFTFRTSVEHYYPQRPEGIVASMSEKDCNRFGNLCLISHSNNSSYSNMLPEAKKQRRNARGANESLKQIIMMSYAEWGPSEQGRKNIQVHEKEVIDILKSTAQ